MSSKLTECTTHGDLNYWLLLFVVEAHRENGQPYPASTLSNLLAGLYCHCQESAPSFPNFMDRKDPGFQKLHGALQLQYRELARRVLEQW